MQRITNANLESLCDAINAAAESPATPCSRDGDRIKNNVGNYHIDSAYGGFKIVQMDNLGGGIRDITSGYRTKRETYDLGRDYLNGLLSSKE